MRRVSRKTINRRRKCRCDGWWFPHRAGSRSDDRRFPGCLCDPTRREVKFEEIYIRTGFYLDD